jgi:hypothetical protein
MLANARMTLAIIPQLVTADATRRVTASPVGSHSPPGSAWEITSTCAIPRPESVSRTLNHDTESLDCAANGTTRGTGNGGLLLHRPRA